jgi:hypothetical protein
VRGGEQVLKFKADIGQGLKEDRDKLEARRRADLENMKILRAQMEQRKKKAQ